MGRWDALDPSRDTHKTRNQGQAPRQPVDGERVAALIDRYRRLVALCHDNPFEHLASLTKLVKENSNDIPPEENTQTVVNDIFLHLLDSRQLHAAEDRTPPHRSTVYSAIFLCLESLLKNTKHRTSVLAPLTDKVLESGVEHQTANPVRIRLFELLQKHLTAVPSSASCLVVALQAAKATDGGNAKRDPNIKLWYIQDYFVRWDTEEHGDFVLLETLVAYQPSISVALCKSLLLRRHRSTSLPCRSCGLSLEGLPKLLKQLHCNNSAHSKSAMRCITGMLRNLPFDQWLSQNRARGISSGHSWTFRDKFVCLIEDVLQTLRCIKSEDSSYADLLVVVLVYTPFQDDDMLFRLAKEVIESISGLRSFREILTRCFGGRVAPNGALTQTAAPVKDWLLQNSWFTQNALTNASASKAFLCGLFRSEPLVVLGDYSMWVAFKQATCVLQKFDRVKAAQLIESLLWGRQCGEEVIGTISSQDLLAFVFQTLDSFCSGNSQLQLAACTSLAHLLESDWEEIQAPERYLQQVLSLCLDERTSQKVKVEGYRAAGKLCSRLLRCQSLSFESNSTSGTILSNSTMLAVLQSDSRVEIRGMALFAAGSLLQAIQHRLVPPERLDTTCLLDLQSLLTGGVSSEEEKIGVNALRSSGILCSLLLSTSFAGERTNLNAMAFVKSVLTSCTTSLTATSLSTGIGLTWKQRTSIKKKARAACRCLEVIFGAISISDSEYLLLCGGPLSTLLPMVSKINRVDNKLAPLILSSLQSMGRRKLAFVITSHGQAQDSLVEGLRGGITIVLTEASSRLSVPRQDFDTTLWHLLGASTEGIVCDLLQELGRETSEQLLRWLTEQPEATRQVLTLFCSACSSFCFDVEIQLMLSNKIGAMAGDFLDEL